MISQLGGNAETVKAHVDAVGKTIKAARLDKEWNAMRLDFTDDTGIKFFDDGQSCCEQRYMECADDLNAVVGAIFNGAEIKDGPTTGDVHEIQFLQINTSNGPITCSNHNEHNGYYGGFAIVVRTTTP